MSQSLGSTTQQNSWRNAWMETLLYKTPAQLHSHLFNRGQTDACIIQHSSLENTISKSFSHHPLTAFRVCTEEAITSAPDPFTSWIIHCYHNEAPQVSIRKMDSCRKPPRRSCPWEACGSARSQTQIRDN